MAGPANCCVHLDIPSCKSKIITFSPVTWTKVCISAEKWKNLGGEEQIISSWLLEMSDKCSLPTDINAGFHQKCYNKFTDKTRIFAVEKRAIRAIPTPSSPENNEDLNRKGSTRSTRSNVGLTAATRRNSLVLLAICIICQNEKYIKEKPTGKRKKEKLSQCETNHNLLIHAATQKNDERLLLHIRDKDLIAIEVKYHRSCYKQYTKQFTKSILNVTSSENEILYEKSFKIFCSDVIENRIIKQQEILRMNKLTDIFVKTVLEHEKVDITGYRSYKLKQKIQSLFSQVQFVKQGRQNKCELVLSETMRDVCHVIDTSSSSETECEEMDISNRTKHMAMKHSHNIIRDLFSSAILLQSKIKDAPSLSALWPPKASDLNLDAAANTVPPELFNFLAWCVGASDEVSLESFVAVPMDTQHKLLSIAQDIIYLSSNGKKQTPKHLSLGMTVRHLTGSAQLISLLNGLGHCVSHTSVLQHDTALALQQLKNNSL